MRHPAQLFNILGIIKYYNVITDGRNFYDQPINSNIKRLKNNTTNENRSNIDIIDTDSLQLMLS